MLFHVNVLIKSRNYYNSCKAEGIINFRYLLTMGASEAALQLLSGELSCQVRTSSILAKSNSLLCYERCFKARNYGDWRYKQINSIKKLQDCSSLHAFHGLHSVFCGEKLLSQSNLLICNCQQPERVSETIIKGGNGKSMHTVSPKIPNLAPDEQNMKQENGARPFSEGFKTAASVNSRPRTNTESIEDEAWHFLRAAMVYYCGSPVGTIAANDPSEATMLNYDQVFIRDFIPSGIAFLLKGEYDIVRNFILHTLQLQVK